MVRLAAFSLFRIKRIIERMSKTLSFLSELKATGHGEVWDDTDRNKFRQFGWRCTTNETSYSNATLIGNWNEQKFDIHRMFQPKPIPSSVSILSLKDVNDVCFFPSLMPKLI